MNIATDLAVKINHAMLNKSKCFSFLHSLNFAIVNSIYCNVILRPKQVVCLEKVFLGRDVLAVLPTGYGKSLIFHLLPLIFMAKERFEKGIGIHTSVVYNSFSPVVIVVSPLNSLINDQILKLASTELEGLRASVLRVKRGDTTSDKEILCDVQQNDRELLENGYFNIVFAHPESFLSCEFGRALLNSKVYQENVRAVVIDEAHCILEW
jgi:ATP-dependent DNA helicase RecQ